jgi:hypothetical protein
MGMRLCYARREIMMMVDWVTRMPGVVRDALVRRGMTWRHAGGRARKPPWRQSEREKEHERSPDVPVHPREDSSAMSKCVWRKYHWARKKSVAATQSAGDREGDCGSGSEQLNLSISSGHKVDLPTRPRSGKSGPSVVNSRTRHHFNRYMR